MTQIEYSIETSLKGVQWTRDYVFTSLEEATKTIDRLRKNLPAYKFRLVQSEWRVIG